MHILSTLSKLSGCLCLCLILQSCAPVAAVAGASLIGGAVIYGQRDFKTIQQDNNIERSLNKMVKDTTDPLSKKERSTIRIITKVFDGNVLLAGQVPNESLSAQLQSNAESIEGVKRISNHITVGKPSSLTQRSKDSMTTTTIKSDLISRGGIKSVQNIRVVTENKVVYLMGTVSNKDKQAAIKVAESTSGVSQVVVLFQAIQ